MPDQQPTSPVDDKTKEVERDVFSWSAPSRPFIQKNRDFWVRVIAISAVFGFIIFIVEGAMPVILMISLIFLFYVLSTVRPENIEYKITNLGVKVGGVTNYYETIRSFFFSNRGKENLLVLDMASFTGRLELVVNEKEKDQIRKILKNHIPEEEPSRTSFDKASEWVNSKLSQTK